MQQFRKLARGYRLQNLLFIDKLINNDVIDIVHNRVILSQECQRASNVILFPPSEICFVKMFLVNVAQTSVPIYHARRTRYLVSRNRSYYT